MKSRLRLSALALNEAAFSAELFRAGILSVNRSQSIGGRARPAWDRC